MKRTEPDDRFLSDGSDVRFVKPDKPKEGWLIKLWDRLWIWAIAFSFMFLTSWRLEKACGGEPSGDNPSRPQPWFAGSKNRCNAGDLKIGATAPKSAGGLINSDLRTRLL